MMGIHDKLQASLKAINEVCDEWESIKDKRSLRGKWPFDYKLRDLFYECDDPDEFDFIANSIFDEWKEASRIAAGYSSKTWDYYDYFEHDRHHGSYFTFRDDNMLDFWSNDIGLEWDATCGKAWSFTDFEKALYECYGDTRFSTDRLTPEEYTADELSDINECLTNITLPKLHEKLNERKAVIEAYDDIKRYQVDRLVAASINRA